MFSARFRTVALAIAAFCAVSGQASAAAPRSAVDFTVKSEPAAAAPNAGRTMKWDASKGRFGVTLDMTQPDVRPSTLNDVQAGAYFRITPSLRVGGSVSLGDQELTPRIAPARPADAPKVRLESSFKF